MKTKLIDVSSIKKSGIRHEVLSEGFIMRVLKYKEILKEVETSSLEETISNFQRDIFPETELAVWESIATCFELHCQKNSYWSLEQKKEAFIELLTSTLR
jgi:hypothetical protein